MRRTRNAFVLFGHEGSNPSDSAFIHKIRGLGYETSYFCIMAKALFPYCIYADYLRNASGMYNLTEFE